MSDDLIRREDAIKVTWQEPTYTDPLNVLTEVRDRINAIPSADRPQDDEFKNFDRESLILLIECQKERIGELLADRPQEWIPCSERLPDEDGEYLVTQKNGSIGRYVLNYDGNSEEYFKRCATAWMPLPKPWKGEDDEVR